MSVSPEPIIAAKMVTCIFANSKAGAVEGGGEAASFLRQRLQHDSHRRSDAMKTALEFCSESFAAVAAILGSVRRAPD
jgi:hypothetical protein